MTTTQEAFEEWFALQPENGGNRPKRTPGGYETDTANRMWKEWQRWLAEGDPRDNAPMPQTVAERQRAFKASQKAAGLVKVEAWVTLEQREKFRELGGDEWLRKRIDAAKVKPPGTV